MTMLRNCIFRNRCITDLNGSDQRLLPANRFNEKLVVCIVYFMTDIMMCFIMLKQILLPDRRATKARDEGFIAVGLEHLGCRFRHTIAPYHCGGESKRTTILQFYNNSVPTP